MIARTPTSDLSLQRPYHPRSWRKHLPPECRTSFGANPNKTNDRMWKTNKYLLRLLETSYGFPQFTSSSWNSYPHDIIPHPHTAVSISTPYGQFSADGSLLPQRTRRTGPSKSRHKHARGKEVKGSFLASSPFQYLHLTIDISIFAKRQSWTTSVVKRGLVLKVVFSKSRS